METILHSPRQNPGVPIWSKQAQTRRRISVAPSDICKVAVTQNSPESGFSGWANWAWGGWSASAIAKEAKGRKSGAVPLAENRSDIRAFPCRKFNYDNVSTESRSCNGTSHRIVRLLYR